ncbi:MAG: fatty acid desaturase [Sporichthyaceae bacterium]
MTITANPSVRQVLSRVVEDPRYPAIARVPLISWPHIGLVVLAYSVFVASTWSYLAGGIPLWAMLLLSQFAVWVSFSPEHDAVHGSVSRNARLNNIVGTISIQLMVPGLCTTVYRILHMEHHRWVGDPERDPDDLLVKAPKAILPLVLIGPVEIWTVWYIRKLWHRRPRRERAMFVATVSIYLGTHIAFLASPWRWDFVLLWLIPQKIGLAVLVYAFAHIQHPAESNWQESPFQSTVRVRANGLGKVYMLGQTDHCIHHALPHIPLHRYHRIWELSDSVLRTAGIPERGFFRGPRDLVLSPATYDNRLPARVVDARVVGGAGIATFVLEGVDGDLPDFTPGSHIDVHLPSGRIRQYSLCNAPGSGRYQIAVKPEADGRGGSMEVHDTFTPGTIVTIGEPRNNFELASAKRCVLVAGGIGVTPLLSMAHYLWTAGVPFDLHVCAQNADAVPFRDELGALPFAESVHVHVDVTPGRTGLDPERDLGPWDTGHEMYVCGPAGFMDWIVGRALDLAWPLDTVHRESFTALEVDRTHDRPFDVVLARRGTTLTVPPHLQILDVLAANDIAVPFSCSQGVCGTCIVPVLEGEVEHRDAVLKPEVRAAHTCMALCVSRAKGDKVVLDL